MIFPFSVGGWLLTFKKLLVHGQASFFLSPVVIRRQDQSFVEQSLMYYVYPLRLLRHDTTKERCLRVTFGHGRGYVLTALATMGYNQDTQEYGDDHQQRDNYHFSTS